MTMNIKRNFPIVALFPKSKDFYGFLITLAISQSRSKHCYKDFWSDAASSKIFISCRISITLERQYSSFGDVPVGLEVGSKELKESKRIQNNGDISLLSKCSVKKNEHNAGTPNNDF